MASYRCAILDDYQNVALKLADYSKVPEVEFKVFNDAGAPHATKRPSATSRTSTSW